MLFQMDVSGVDAEEALETYWGSLASGPEGESLAREIVSGYARSQAEIDGIIREVSHHWRIERMTIVDRNILRLATFELLRLPNVPRRVTLNEAVELAKRFGSEGSPGFVNGILDKIASDLEKE